MTGARREAVLVVGLVTVLLIPAWRSGVPFADDYVYRFLTDTQEVFAPVPFLTSLQGAWRILAAVATGPLFHLFAHQLSLMRLLGVLAHLASGLLARSLWRRLGGGEVSGVVLLVMFLLYPYSLEAVTWPTNSVLYAYSVLLALAGATLASRAATAGLSAAGAAAMAAAPLVHEQTFGIVVVLAVVLAARGVAHRAAILVGAAVPTLFWLYSLSTVPAGNPRWAGEGTVSVGNVVRNLGFVWTGFRRTTPLGDLYWNPGNFGQWWTVISVLVALGLVAVCLRPALLRAAAAPWPAGIPMRFPALAAVAALAAGAVSLAPALALRDPWFTARTTYVPSLALAALVAAGADAMTRRTRRIGTPVATAIATVTIVWGSVALGAEADAVGDQLRASHARREPFVDALAGTQIDQATMVVVAGVPYTDVERPLFGEHLIAHSPSDFEIGVWEAGYSVYPRVDIHGFFDGVCMTDAGRVTVTPEWVEAHRTQWLDAEPPITRVVYLLWDGRRWAVQAGTATLGAANTVAAVATCAPDEADLVDELLFASAD